MLSIYLFSIEQRTLNSNSNLKILITKLLKNILYNYNGNISSNYILVRLIVKNCYNSY